MCVERWVVDPKHRWFLLGAMDHAGGMKTIDRALEIIKAVRDFQRTLIPTPLADLMLQGDDPMLLEMLAEMQVN